MTRLVRYTTDAGVAAAASDLTPGIRYGILDGDSIVETGRLSSVPTGGRVARGAVRLLPPCSPTKIVCVGRNYSEHAKELGNEVPAEPLIFLKPPSSLAGDGDAIVYPSLSQRVDYEGELGVVIGRRTRHASVEEAMDAVYGYTCVNDVTARDLQKRDGQWTRGKGFDTFCPVGPWIVPAAEVDLGRVRVRTTVDGVVKQDAPLTDLLFPVPVIIAYISAFLTLEPGDLIATGTPPGVGAVQPGAVIAIEVEGVGILTNPVASGE